MSYVGFLPVLYINLLPLFLRFIFRKGRAEFTQSRTQRFLYLCTGAAPRLEASEIGLAEADGDRSQYKKKRANYFTRHGWLLPLSDSFLFHVIPSKNLTESNLLILTLGL